MKRLILIASLLLSSSAWADGDPTTDNTPKVIAYQGTLERAGQPFDGDVEMTFRLYDGPTLDLEPVWSETQTVQILAGRFTALLGSVSEESVAALTLAIQAADNIHLGMALRSGEVDIELGGRQRFTPMPYATWTTASVDFDVARDLNVGRNVVVDGNVSILGDISAASIQLLGSVSAALIHSSGLIQARSIEVTELIEAANVRAGSVFGLSIQASDLIQARVIQADERIESVAISALDRVTANTVAAEVVATQILSAFGTITTPSILIGNSGDPAESNIMIRGKNAISVEHDDEWLRLNDDSEFASGVHVRGAFSVNGSVNIVGPITSTGGDCRETACGMTEHTVPSAERAWGTWQNWETCADHKYVCGIRMKDDDRVGTTELQIRCCRL